MLIPHLHFCGNCQEAITLYEQAFSIKAEAIISSREYVLNNGNGGDHITHAVMYIHGQKVFLNDRFGKPELSYSKLAVYLKREQVKRV